MTVHTKLHKDTVRLRQCTVCRESLVASHEPTQSLFYVKRRAGVVVGWEGRCKECVIEVVHAYRNANRARIYARIREYARTFDRNTPERVAKRLATTARYRKTKKALSPELDRRKVRVVHHTVGV
jgi:hypothetical protein